MAPRRRMLRIGARVPVSPAWGVIAGAVIRAGLTAVIGAVLTAALGMLLWAITPQSGPNPITFARAGVTAFAAGHFLPVAITADGRTAEITMAPLLITGLMVVVIASLAGRASASASGRVAEAVAAGLTGLVYGLATNLISWTFASPHTVSADRWWAPMLLGGVAALFGLVLRGHAWRDYLAAPDWVLAGLRAGALAGLTLLAGGFLALSISLIISFGTLMRLFAMASPTPVDGAGLLIICMLIVPNAAIAGMSFSLGAGFQIGAGTYSPLGTTAADLPGLPILAGVPASGGMSISLALVAVPVLAAVLACYVIARQVSQRIERVLAAICAGVVAGTATALACLLALGGVNQSSWAQLGLPVLLAGGIAALAVTAIAGVVVVVLPVAETGAQRSQESSEDDDTVQIDRVP